MSSVDDPLTDRESAPEPVTLQTILEQMESSLPGLGEALHIFNNPATQFVKLSIKDDHFDDLLDGYALHLEGKLAIVLLPKYGRNLPAIGEFAIPTGKRALEAINRFPNLEEVVLIANLGDLEMSMPTDLMSLFSSSVPAFKRCNQFFISFAKNKKPMAELFSTLIGRLAQNINLIKKIKFDYSKDDFLQSIANYYRGQQGIEVKEEA